MEYESYLEAILPFLRTGGLLVADNILSHQGTLEKFVAAVQQKRELQSVVLPLGTGLLMALKAGDR